MAEVRLDDDVGVEGLRKATIGRSIGEHAKFKFMLRAEREAEEARATGGSRENMAVDVKIPLCTYYRLL